MDYQFITTNTRGPVTTITLNRPAVMNAVNAEMHVELEHALDTFAEDSRQHVCVLTGAGNRAFCAGSDLKAARDEGIGRGRYPKSGYGGIAARFDLDKPVIAAVNGAALGGGFEIALACDLIIAAESATFGLPEPLIGAVALGGGVHRLVRQIGLKQAMGLILSSQTVSAQEGLRLGFVNEVAPAAELESVVARWTEMILRGAPLAIRASKALANRGLEEPTLAAALQNQAGYPAFAAWRDAEDTREGVIAFGEKRPPRWKGR